MLGNEIFRVGEVAAKVFTNGKINWEIISRASLLGSIFLTRKERVGASKIMLLSFHPAKDPGFL